MEHKQIEMDLGDRNLTIDRGGYEQVMQKNYLMKIDSFDIHLY